MQYLPGLLIFVSTWVHGAALWQGTVAYVTDGDTLWVRPSSAELDDKSARKIRIEGIDAPEVCQAYGEQSKTALKQRLLQQKVTIHSRRVDDYGRDVAKITLNTQDIGAWMVSQGHAWSYHYRHSAGPYAAQEHEARSGKRGLFAAPAPVEPRVFRRTHGSCHTPRN
jgi:endonuclease YncB( thermonuclease family)